MTIKRAKYQINKEDYHFETDDKSVKILDSNNNEVGNLKQLMFEGKPLSNISYKDIKVPGVYRVHGFNDRDLPQGIPNNQDCLLKVEAIGNLNNPSVINYKIVTPDGKSFESTVSGGTSARWSVGGVSLNTQLGELSDRATDLERDISGVIKTVDQNKQTEAQHYNEFKSHNHNSQYVFKNGDTVNGNLTINGSVNVVSGNNVGSMRIANGKLTIGNTNQQTELTGKGDLLYNGKRVVVVGSSGTGIDADTLNGKSSSRFVDTYGDSMFGNLSFYNNNGIAFMNDKYQDAASIYGTKSGGIVMDGDGKDITIINANGVNFGNTPLQVSGQMYSMTNQKVMHLGYGTNGETVYINHSPYIGEHASRLFLQSEAPSGDIPDGSVWIGY